MTATRRHMLCLTFLALTTLWCGPISGLTPAGFELDNQSIIDATYQMEKYLAARKLKLVSHGRARISAQRGICWQVTDPVRKTWFIHQGVVSDLSSTEGDTTADTPAFMTQGFMALLLGDVSQISPDYNLRINQDEQGNTKLYLRPQDPKLTQIIDLISIHIVRGYVQNIRVVEKSGSSTSLTFDQFKTDKLNDLDLLQDCRDKVNK